MDTETTQPDAKKTELFKKLIDLDHDYGPEANQNTRAIVLISQCISEGITDEGQIIAVLMHLGLGNKHLGAVLTKSTGTNPARHIWQRHKDGTYCLLDGNALPVLAISAAHISVST